MNDPRSWDVYLVTDRSFSRDRSTIEIVRSAVEGGVSAVQLREKHLETRDLYHEGRTIRDFLRHSRVPLIVNDRIDMALALDAEGVHVGQSDMPIGIARKILGPGRLIGLSIESLEQMDEEAVANADYLAISPVFTTGTKTDTAKPWGLDGLARARALTDKPLVAIGSIGIDNAREVVAHGADCIAVVTAVTMADDPAAAVAALVKEVQAGKRDRHGC
jgi:thiamine-phosphate pyrophosphorylase